MANKLRHGQARVEFLASKAEIFDLLKKGHSIKDVHGKLIGKGTITMSYTALISFIKKKEKSIVTEHQESTNCKQRTEIVLAEIENTPQSKIIEGSGSEDNGSVGSKFEDIEVEAKDIF